jgi:hypothetical protein
MSTKDTLENLAKKTWLAGLGSIDSSKEALSKSIDAAQEKSNNLYNELLARGAQIQSKISDTKDEIELKSKKFLGLGADKSEEEKLADLNTTVDNLTTVVVKLIEEQNAKKEALNKSAPKARAKAATKTAAKKPATKTSVASAPKADAKPAAKADAKPAAKAKTKPAAKAKPAVKTDAKPAAKTDAKPAPKADVKPAPKADAKPSSKAD